MASKKNKNLNGQIPGRLGTAAQKFILANASKMTPEEIAKKFGKKPDLIYRFLREHADKKDIPPVDFEDKASIREELRQSESYKRLKVELTLDELKMFESDYANLIMQFAGDVLFSEKSQISMSIKYGILMSRNLEARAKAIKEITRMEAMMEDHMARHNNDPKQMDQNAKTLALTIETQIQASRANEQAFTNEYVKLAQQQDRIMEALKCTRNQRAVDVANSKVDFLSLVKSLMVKEVSDRAGRSAALMKLAGEKEYKRLGELHTFEDGSVDRPILSPETLDT